MTDDQLQQQLKHALSPTPLGDDAAIEAALDARVPASDDHAYGQGIVARAQHQPLATADTAPPQRWVLAAALVVLAAIPVAVFTIATSDQPDSGTPGAEARSADGGDGPAPGGMVEHHLDFPPPIFTGTPADIDLPNLEPAHPPRLTFTAPAGVELVSAGAPVASSAPAPLAGRLHMVTDGDKSGEEGAILELPRGPQWVQIDLGESREIFAITVWHYHKMWRAYRDVVVQASDDPTFATGAYTVFNNDHDDSLGLGAGEDLAYIETEYGRIIDVAGLRARYLRLHSNGNTHDDLNHYVEVEVYGL